MMWVLKRTVSMRMMILDGLENIHNFMVKIFCLFRPEHDNSGRTSKKLLKTMSKPQEILFMKPYNIDSKYLFAGPK